MPAPAYVDAGGCVGAGGAAVVVVIPVESVAPVVVAIPVVSTAGCEVPTPVLLNPGAPAKGLPPVTSKPGVPPANTKSSLSCLG